MKKAKEVVPVDSRELRSCPRLQEMVGEVFSSETTETGYGSCLVLGVNGFEGEIWWQAQSRMPAHIVVGDKIRGFYRAESSGGTVRVLEAYELLDEKSSLTERILTRASSRAYRFVD